MADRHRIRSYADLATRRPPLRIVVAPNDGINGAGFAVERILRAYDVRWSDIPAWDGRWLEFERPPKAGKLITSGETDAIFCEGVMTWPGFTEQRPMRFLSLDDPVLAALHAQYGYTPATIEAGEFRGLEAPVTALEWG